MVSSVCRENLEIGEPEVLLSLLSLLRFKSDSANWLDSLSEFSLSFGLSILDMQTYTHTHTHTHTHTRARIHVRLDLAVLTHEELLIQTIVKRKQAS